MILRDVEARRRKAMEVCSALIYFTNCLDCLVVFSSSGTVLCCITTTGIIVQCSFAPYVTSPFRQVMVSRRETEQARSKEAVEEVRVLKLKF